MKCILRNLTPFLLDNAIQFYNLYFKTLDYLYALCNRTRVIKDDISPSYLIQLSGVLSVFIYQLSGSTTFKTVSIKSASELQIFLYFKSYKR